MIHRVGFVPYTKYLERQEQFELERNAINVLYGDNRQEADALIAQALSNARFEQYVDAAGHLTERNVRILKNDGSFWSSRRVERIESIGAGACFVIIAKSTDGTIERIEVLTSMSILVEML